MVQKKKVGCDVCQLTKRSRRGKDATWEGGLHKPGWAALLKSWDTDLSLVSSISCWTDTWLESLLQLQPQVIQRPCTALTGPGARRPCYPLRLPTRSPAPSRSSRLTQAARGGEPGGGAGARSAPEAAPGSTRPGRSRHVTGAARSPSRAGPSDPPAMGDEDEDEGCAVELQITEGGCRIPRRLPRTGGKSQRPAGLICPPVPAANLTGHEEKVSVENFALLKVLGTGGEKPRSLG